MAYQYDDDSGFKGPFTLENEIVADTVGDNYGVYLLAKFSQNFWSSKYEIKYVGRGHLKTRLNKRVGQYTHFYYKVANIEYTRFRIECEEFHRYGKANELDNDIHPARPTGDYKKCTELGCNGEAN